MNRNRRAACTLALAVVAVSCDSHPAGIAPVDFPGRWVLGSINGKRLPYVMAVFGDELTIQAETLHVHPNGTWGRVQHARRRAGAQVTRDTGNYTLSGDSVRLTAVPNDLDLRRTALRQGDRIMIVGPAMFSTYQKR